MTRLIVDLNGSQCEFLVGTTLLSLIESTAGATRGSAVVVDGVVVPRSAWPTYRMRAGQRIELIQAVQGG